MICRVGLVGVGTVGGGVAEILLKEAASLKQRTGGALIQLAAAADLDPERLAPLRAQGVATFSSADALIARDDIDVVVELIGGTGVAKRAILTALAARKSVVTANKHLLAEAGAEIVRAAQGTGAALGFSASVCGGVPVLLALRTGLVANEIASVIGIVNGTCNYILTEMSQRGVSYADALAEAQAKGYAEVDPALDVEGHDSAHKLAILASLAFRAPITTADIQCEGIARLEVIDIRYAEELGYVVKLLAIGKRADHDHIELRVHPTLLPRDHPLAAVHGVFNAVELTGSAVGRVMLFGRGAGRYPTASNVIADIVEIARGSAARPQDQLAFWAQPRALPVAAAEQARSRYYTRFTVKDEYGVLGRMAQILGEQRVSIASVMQKEPHDPEQASGVPIVVLTHEAREGDFRAAISEIDRCDFTKRPTVFLRIEEA
ncbi:MAG: homoserine dehydrogenase [Vicinamibacteria bacterium]|jgi:homoserine dehydrogenase|nr:homoserine dehydrogenase [Vicinamibacteria bacterium]